ncbi:MAG TPA: ATP-binding protein [Tepidisphaeraceae bacterium]|jgi:two-component system phosphate regulon sensor histidine kinase PhoR|nr:ATP-binding protein [Tepidisphaeraceae bacterium]
MHLSLGWEHLVRRTLAFSILALLLAAAGVACLVIGKLHAGQTDHLDLLLYGGLASLAASAATSFAITLWSRANYTALLSATRGVDLTKQLAALNTTAGEFHPLAKNVDDVISSAGDSVRKASLKVKELEIQLKVADAERQHAQAILYSISDAVLVTDTFDELVMANESAAKTFSFDLEKTTRHPIDHVLKDLKVIELIRDMRQSNSKNGRRITEHTIKGESGGNRTFKVTLSSVCDQTDNPAGVVAVLHDMTREKEVAEMKNDFVSNVSHELRTPLASIKAYVEMLIDGEADDEKTTREFYDVIQGEANRLGRLIDNILNVSRIESGLVKINKQPQSLTVIIKEALEVISPQAKQKNISIIEQLTPVYYQTVADHDMLYQAMLNLLSNCVKYTPEGGTITVQTLVDESKKSVITKISDTGVGIPPKDLPFVFDKFYRVEANNRMAKGTGLGLPLVKHIIETVHHGKIFLTSEVGVGSTFGFELEMAE